jgi:hypothetical protein
MNRVQLAPNTCQMPSIPVVAVEAAEMQHDAIEMSEICWSDSGFGVHHLFLKLLSTDISENVNCLDRSRAWSSSTKIGWPPNQAGGWRRLAAGSGQM